MRIAIIAGARPNFMKVAPIIHALQRSAHEDNQAIEHILIHTGQHYDENMSESFFRELELPAPDVNLEVGSGSHAVQTAEIMKRFDEVCDAHQFSHILVVGDVNSTMATALVAVKRGIGVIHVEAGLRSFDRTMPEEINRVLTDAISDVLFTTEKSASENLIREGVNANNIHFVGNVMIDTLKRYRDRAKASTILSRLGVDGYLDYGVLTLHRPSNVDDSEKLLSILAGVSDITKHMPVFFPVHPRTAKQVKIHGCGNVIWLSGEARIGTKQRAIFCLKPLGYLDFLHLMACARIVLTDSGGIQEETTILKVPCITIRDNTERPVTVSHGTNRLAGTKRESIAAESMESLKRNYDNLTPPPLWDGNAAERIVKVLLALI